MQHDGDTTVCVYVGNMMNHDRNPSPYNVRDVYAVVWHMASLFRSWGMSWNFPSAPQSPKPPFPDPSLFSLKYYNCPRATLRGMQGRSRRNRGMRAIFFCFLNEIQGNVRGMDHFCSYVEKKRRRKRCFLKALPKGGGEWPSSQSILPKSLNLG